MLDTVYKQTNTSNGPPFPGLPGQAGTRKVNLIWIVRLVQVCWVSQMNFELATTVLCCAMCIQHLTNIIMRAILSRLTVTDTFFPPVSTPESAFGAYDTPSGPLSAQWGTTLTHFPLPSTFWNLDFGIFGVSLSLRTRHYFYEITTLAWAPRL